MLPGQHIGGQPVRQQCVEDGFIETADGQGAGMELHATAGYAFLRHSTIRMFAQADLYSTDRKDDYDYDMTTGEASLVVSNDIWIPTATVSLGLGF